MITQIKTLDDVSVFTKKIICEGVAVHPDDNFSDMISVETQEYTYTSDEAELRNTLMRQCIEVCKKNNISIYDFMQKIYLKETELDKFIPLPSSPISFKE
jgi:hypothetical protein